jgi:hypothetical protein
MFLQQHIGDSCRLRDEALGDDVTTVLACGGGGDNVSDGDRLVTTEIDCCGDGIYVSTFSLHICVPPTDARILPAAIPAGPTDGDRSKLRPGLKPIAVTAVRMR